MNGGEKEIELEEERRKNIKVLAGETSARVPDGRTGKNCSDTMRVC
jgi:hypothetical protein